MHIRIYKQIHIIYILYYRYSLSLCIYIYIVYTYNIILWILYMYIDRIPGCPACASHFFLFAASPGGRSADVRRPGGSGILWPWHPNGPKLRVDPLMVFQGDFFQGKSGDFMVLWWLNGGFPSKNMVIPSNIWFCQVVFQAKLW